MKLWLFRFFCLVFCLVNFAFATNLPIVNEKGEVLRELEIGQGYKIHWYGSKDLFVKRYNKNRNLNVFYTGISPVGMTVGIGFSIDGGAANDKYLRNFQIRPLFPYDPSPFNIGDQYCSEALSCFIRIDFTPMMEGEAGFLLYFEHVLFDNRAVPPAQRVPDVVTVNQVIFQTGAYDIKDSAQCSNNISTISGSIIGPEKRTLAEKIKIVGTDFDMTWTNENTDEYFTTFPKAVRVPSFNPEGWSISLVHYYDFTNQRLFTGDGHSYKKSHTSLPGGNFSVVHGNEMFIFNSLGQHKQTKSLKNDFVKFNINYGSSRKVVSIVDAYGKTTYFARGTASRLQQITSPFGQITTITTNSEGLITSVLDPEGKKTEFAYAPGKSLLETFTYPIGRKSTFTYNAIGELDLDASDAGYGTGLFPSFEDGKHTVYAGSAMERVSKYQMGFNSATQTYSRSAASPAGFVQNYSEDANLNLTHSNIFESSSTQTVPDERFGSQSPRLSQEVKTINGLTRTTNYSQVVMTLNPTDPFAYGQITNTMSVNGVDTVSTYVKATKTQTVTYPNNLTQVTVYDSKEKPASIKNGTDVATTYSYNSLGQLTQSTQNGINTFSYTYDSKGNLRTVTNALGQTTTYGYSDSGLVTSITRPDGRVVLRSHDADGNILSVKPPLKGEHLFDFNQMGLLSSYNPPATAGLPNSFTEYYYNNDKQLVDIFRPDGKHVKYNYDATTGLLSSLDLDEANDQIYVYIPNSEKIQNVTSPDGVKSEFEYFGLNDILSENQTIDEVSQGSVHFTFDNFFRPTARVMKLDNVEVGSVTTTYRDDGQPSQVGDLTQSYDSANSRLVTSVLNKIHTEWTFDSYGNVASQTATYRPNSSTINPLYQYTLTRDTLHRVTTKVEIVQGVTTTFEYSYDSFGRLSSVTKNGVVDSSYTYDTNSNRTSGTQNGVAFTATYDNLDRLRTFTLAGSPVMTFSYNANGEMTSMVQGSNTTTYDTDALGRLKSATLPDATQVSYKLDWAGRRASRLVNGVQTSRRVYDSELRLGAENDNGTIKEFIYGSAVGTSPDYIKVSGVDYKVIKDHLGSPRLVVNASTGVVAQRMDYNEWGEVIADTNPGFQPHGFAGGLYDPATKLVKFGARDYNGKVGRWTSKDPIRFEGGDTNLYGYVLQDPVNYLDPRGLNSTSAIYDGFGNAVGYLDPNAGSFVGSVVGAGLGTVACGPICGTIGGVIGGQIGGGMCPNGGSLNVGGDNPGRDYPSLPVPINGYYIDPSKMPNPGNDYWRQGP